MKRFCLFATSISIVLSLFGFAFAQQSERTVKRKIWRNEPLKITSVKVRNTTVNYNQVFLNENDWFNNLAVTIKNVSNKTIVFVSLGVNFPAPSSTELPVQLAMLRGRDTSLAVKGDGAVSNDPLLQPNDTATLVFSDYEANRQLLNQVGQPQSIGQLELEISEVIFSDNTSWRSGTINTRDLNNPEMWIPTKKANLIGGTFDLVSLYQATKINFIPKAKLFRGLPVSLCKVYLGPSRLPCSASGCAVTREDPGGDTLPSDPNGYRFRTINAACFNTTTGQSCYSTQQVTRTDILC